MVVPNDSYRAADFAAAAEALDIDLAIASEERPPLRPDDRFVQVDCRDVETSARAMADLAARTPVDAIISADDTGVAMAARASELIGLTSNPPAAAAATLDKAVMRRLLAAAEVPQPAHLLITGDDSASEAVAEVGLPAVIKPRNLSASRGVVRVDAADSADGVAAEVREIIGDPDAVLLVEEYVDGPELSVEGVVWDGDVEVLAILDKPVPMQGPAFEETIFVTPSRHPAPVLDEVERVTRMATAALGLTNGPIHAEFRVAGGRPRVIEIAARTIGGLCGRSLRFGLLGAPLETMVLRQALGMRKTSLRREHAASGVLMIPIPRRGRLRGLAGLEGVEAIDEVTAIEVTAPIGSEVAPPPYGEGYLGFVFARADDPARVEQVLRTAMDAIVVDVEGISPR